MISNPKRQPTMVYCSSQAWLGLTRALDQDAAGFRSSRSVEFPDEKMGLGAQNSRRQGNLGVEGKSHGI
jgi:hypothetical protein